MQSNDWCETGLSCNEKWVFHTLPAGAPEFYLFIFCSVFVFYSSEDEDFNCAPPTQGRCFFAHVLKSLHLQQPWLRLNYYFFFNLKWLHFKCPNWYRKVYDDLTCLVTSKLEEVLLPSTGTLSAPFVCEQLVWFASDIKFGNNYISFCEFQVQPFFWGEKLFARKKQTNKCLM